MSALVRGRISTKVRYLLLYYLTLLMGLIMGACGSGDNGIQRSPTVVPTLYNVIEEEDLGTKWDCARPIVCIEDSRRFIDRAQPYSHPITLEDLHEQIGSVEDGEVDVITDPASVKDIGKEIIDILNIRFLLEGINQRPLRATTIRKIETADFFEKDLLFHDPFLGTFEGILMVPKGEGPFPGIVAIHGHNDSARKYRDRYHGREYPAHGYAILMLTMRAMGFDLLNREHSISKELLLNGFTLIGLRIYETLLGTKYLRYLPEVLSECIFLIGHSGGSSASNLTIRVEKGFSAYVSDYTHDYCDWGWFFNR